jgi:hypothetical protein
MTAQGFLTATWENYKDRSLRLSMSPWLVSNIPGAQRFNDPFGQAPKVPAWGPLEQLSLAS